MTAQRSNVSQLMHGHDWNGEDCAGWLFQRKWNGLSATWDGQRLWTKPSAEHPQGNVIQAPGFFLAGLPDWPLCCELLAAREGDQFANALKRNWRNAVEWERAKLMVFDAPHAEFSDVCFRLAEAAGHLSEARHADITITRTLRDRAHLRDELRAVLDAGGEGLMIQPPDNPYVAGRTRRLLKVKRGSLHVFRTL